VSFFERLLTHADVSQRVFLEESASLRSHMLAIHAFPKAVTRVVVNARAAVLDAAADIERTAMLWAVQEHQAAYDAGVVEGNLAIARRWGEAVHCEAVFFCDQVLVYFRWMEEAFQAANLEILNGLCLFAKAHSSDDEEEECEDDELIYVDGYIRSCLPEAAEIPDCDSVTEAVQRLDETIVPALREARAQLDLSWRLARVDWPGDGAESYEAGHYTEIDRASAGFERVLEALILGLSKAIEEMPPPPGR
jgi:hypothetical protein